MFWWGRCCLVNGNQTRCSANSEPDQEPCQKDLYVGVGGSCLKSCADQVDEDEEDARPPKAKLPISARASLPPAQSSPRDRASTQAHSAG